jgi:HEXXH motif-containing protein
MLATTQIISAQSFQPEWQSSDFVEQALMPQEAITTELVRISAFDRLDDFRALASIVQASPQLAEHSECWQQACCDLDELSTAKQIAIGSSPLYRGWLHATGRALIGGAPPLTLKPLLASVANYVSGFTQDTSHRRALMSRNGRIETWDCAGSVELPAGYSADKWHCQLNGTRAELSCASMNMSTVIAQIVAPEARLPESNIAIRNDLPSLQIMLDETRVPERGSAVLEQQVDARESSYPVGQCCNIVQAAQAVLSVWPEEYADWRCTMRVVVPRLPPPRWQKVGFTISSMQGAAWINPCNSLHALESLVHEHSHVKLRYLEEAVALLQAEQSNTRFAIGWRTDPRPMIGIFEGVYVHLHCIMALDRHIQSNDLDSTTRRNAIARLTDLRIQAREGFCILRDHARFTAAGQGFLRWASSALREV